MSLHVNHNECSLTMKPCACLRMALTWSDVWCLRALFLLLLAITITLTLILEMTTVTTKPAVIHYVRNHRFITCSDCVDGRRMGNLMFNYASLLGIAKRNNMSVIIPDTFDLGTIFELKVKQVPKHDVERFVSPMLIYEEQGRRACAYDTATEHLNEFWNYELVGYYQSWRYFENVKSDLRQHFCFQAPILKQAQTFLSKDVPRKLQGIDIVKVGIHVRRGDILIKKEFGYTVANAAYFKKAMGFFMKHYPKAMFIVCTDDLAWAKENIIGENVVFSEGNSAPVDLAILSLCDHMIMSVGSFSWWAAWLANGTTVYYEKWPHPATILEYKVDKKQYFPSHWISLS